MPAQVDVRSLWARVVHLVVVLAVVGSTVAVVSVATAGVANAAPCTPPVVNKVACENTRTGTDGWQALSTDQSLAGFTTDISATPGERVDFKIATDAPSYRVDVFRLGWYGGVGGRQVAAMSRTTPQSQPDCLRDATGLADCGNWAVSVSWQVPADAISGLYYARLRRDDTGGENEIVFVVRDDASTSDILFQTSDSTWQAYNRYGGASLYVGDGPGKDGSAFKVSYNRPILLQNDEDFIFNAEYPMLRFLERNGYDLSYTTNVDTARRGNLIRNHDVFMAVGHDEYWSNEQRASVEAARDAGVHLAFMTGNEVFWKTRWEPSIAGGAVDWRTVVSYKETKAPQVDPSTEWTGTWRDPRFSPRKDGGRPENALLGNIFTVNGRRDDSLQVPAAHGRMRLWRGTDLASLAAGATYTFRPGTLGYEWNTVEDNGFQPPGVAQLSRTTVDLVGPFALQNYGDAYASERKTHALTLYRAPSGALVFGAGTVQWAWGVDDEHAYLTNTPTSDPRMQQATVNLLADMGVQPTTLQAGLVSASASTDTTAPTAAITSVPGGATVGSTYTFSGTVSDAAGQVAGVEVSTDAGVTWHPASWTAGAGTWSYGYVPTASGPAGLRVRAVDDSANLSAPVSAAVPVSARTCPCSIWPAGAVPDTVDNADGVALELGVKWRSASDGFVRGVRFYKADGDTAGHTGTLWSATGQEIATGTFSNETATGWQTLLFPTPVAVAADTTYVVSYLSPQGRYAADADYFAPYSRTPSGLEPLRALRSGEDGPNGVFAVGGHAFPTRTSQATNYWVDVVWAPDPGPDTRTPALTDSTPIAGSTSVAMDTVLTATFDEPIARASVQFTVTDPGGRAVAGTVGLSADSRTVTFTPSQPLAASTVHAVSLSAADPAGNRLASPARWTFTTGAQRPVGCPCTLWDDFARPATESSLDSGAIEVGTKVRFDGRGEVLGVRFFKGVGNTGTHTGSLWTADGQRLATGTFTGESSTGWQTLTFATPVAVAPNRTYVVSYFAPNGRYAVTGGLFAGRGVEQPPLRALADGVDGGNGVFRYGAGGGFPTSTFGGNAYFVDVVFRSGLNGDTTPPTVSGSAPPAGGVDVAVGAGITAAFSEPMDLEAITLTVTDPGGARIDGTGVLSADGRTYTWRPAAPLGSATTYAVRLLGADANGVVMTAARTWSFTTGGAPSCPCSLFSAATLPTVPSDPDTGAYELGVRIVPGANGTISGVRFYKGAGNTGTHTGSLWNSSGRRLATGTFVDETATGWQTLQFATPVVVQAGQAYVASYTTTTGRFSVTAGYFAGRTVDTPLLDAPATSTSTPNGVFAVGSGFPDRTFGGNNYWVDALYTPNPDQVAPSVVDRSPAPGATGVSPAAPVVVTFDEPIDPGDVTVTVTDPGGARLTGDVTASIDGRTVTWTPAAPLGAATRHTVVLRAADVAGNVMPAPSTWSFTTATTRTCPCTLYSAATVPTVPAVADTASYELGIRFTASVEGQVTGVRFFKGPGNTGTHTGTLWSAGGAPLATGTFTGETESGWQTLSYATPVPVTAGTTYVASYTAPAGRFSVDEGYFGRTAVSNPPLAAQAVGNGVFGAGPGFPTQTFNNNNYWVDVVLLTGTAPPPEPGVLAVTPASADLGAVEIGSTRATTVTLRNTGGTPVTVTRFTAPAAPFSAGPDLTGRTIPPGGSLTTTATYAPTGASNGDTGSLVIAADDGRPATTVALTGSTVGGAVNLAQGRPATQSSTSPATGGIGTPSRAVDSRTDGVFANGSVTHTNNDPASWWQVDLGATRQTDRIVVWNRTDCCGERLRDYWVFVSNTPFTTALTPAQQAARPGVWSSRQTAQPNPSTSIGLPAGTSGRYVMVQQGLTNEVLSLAEIQVLGRPPAVLSVTPPAAAFGAVDVGTTRNATVTVANTGAAPLTIAGVTGSAAPFSVAPDLTGRVLAPGASATTTVTYAPTVASNGDTGSLTVTAQDGQTSTVTLSGSTTGGAANVAQGRTATQSSTAGSAVASRAVDGRTDGVFANASVTETNGNPASWWQVDLGASRRTDQIVVWNRTDCCADRLRDYWVFVSNTPFNTALTPAQQAARPGVWSSRQTVQPNPSATVRPPAGTTGRYVMVQQGTANTILSLAEVQVVSTPPGVLAVAPTTRDLGTVAVGSTATATVTLSNTGVTPVAVTGFTAPVAPFSVSPDPTGRVIAPGGTSTLTVTYAPAAASNRDTGSFTVTGDDGRPATTVTLTGATIGGAVNLAQGRTAVQSSTDDGYTAGRAVDGRTDGNARNGSVSGTDDSFSTYSWWQVDLGASRRTDQIVVWNRTDCCAAGLDDYWVFVSNTPFTTSLSPTQQAARAGVWSTRQTTRPNPSTVIRPPAGMTGRYVMIQQSDRNENLYLAEVQVIGSPPGALAVTPTSADLGTVAVGSTATATVTLSNTGATPVTVTGFTAPAAPFSVPNPTGRTIPAGGSTTLTATYAPTSASGRDTRTFTVTGDDGRPATTVTLTGAATGGVVNHAQGRTATQSSTAFSGAPGRAVDGRTDGVYNNGSVSHTDVNPSSWWQVDLGASRRTDQIVVWNRTDCCADRLRDYWVFVSSTPFNTALTPAQQAAQPGVWSVRQTVQPDPSTTIRPPAGTTGRYVLVQLGTANQYLSLAEVQVLGSP